MTHRNVVELGKLVSVKGGKRLPKGTTLQTEKNSHPYIRVRDMGQRYIPDEGLEYVPDEVFPSIKRYIVEENDLIISIVGTIGLVSVIDQRFHLASQSENCAKLTGLNATDATYVYYYLSSTEGQAEIRKGVVGAVQEKLPLYNIEKIAVPWLDGERRQKITEILSSLDEKIEFNRKQNRTLEAIAQALFKRWFVEYEFPDENGRPYKSSGGAMQPSELGEIPVGWEVKKYCDFVSISTGKGLPQSLRDERGDYPVYGANGIIAQTNEVLFDGKFILTGRVGTLGTVFIVEGKMWISDNVLISKPGGGEGFYFSYFVLKRFNFAALNRGSTQPLLTQGDLGSEIVAFPPIPYLKEFESVVSSLFRKMRKNNQQIATLNKLRDTLLPKLMSGELRVGVAA